MAKSIALHINIGSDVSVSITDESVTTNISLPPGPDFCGTLRECVENKSKIIINVNGEEFKEISSLKDFDNFFPGKSKGENNGNI
jgi:hypothetical protein